METFPSANIGGRKLILSNTIIAAMNESIELYPFGEANGFKINFRYIWNPSAIAMITPSIEGERSYTLTLHSPWLVVNKNAHPNPFYFAADTFEKYSIKVVFDTSGPPHNYTIFLIYNIYSESL